MLTVLCRAGPHTGGISVIFSRNACSFFPTASMCIHVHYIAFSTRTFAFIHNAYVSVAYVIILKHSSAFTIVTFDSCCIPVHSIAFSCILKRCILPCCIFYTLHSLLSAYHCILSHSLAFDFWLHTHMLHSERIVSVCCICVHISTFMLWLHMYVLHSVCISELTVCSLNTCQCTSMHCKCM